MEKLKSVFRDRILSLAVNFTAYFLLLMLVVPTNSGVRIVAGVLLGAAIIAVIVSLIRALQHQAPETGGKSIRISRLFKTLIPVGFLVLALVMAAPDSWIMPLLYLFLGLYVLTGIARLVIRRK